MESEKYLTEAEQHEAFLEAYEEIKNKQAIEDENEDSEQLTFLI